MDIMELVYQVLTGQAPAYSLSNKEEFSREMLTSPLQGWMCAETKDKDRKPLVSLEGENLEVSSSNVGSDEIILTRDQTHKHYVLFIRKNDISFLYCFRNAADEFKMLDFNLMTAAFPNADFERLKLLVRDPLVELRKHYGVFPLINEKGCFGGISLPIVLRNYGESTSLVSMLGNLVAGAKFKSSGDPLQTLEGEYTTGSFLSKVKMRIILKTAEGGRTEILGNSQVIASILKRTVLGDLLQEYWASKEGISIEEAKKRLEAIAPEEAKE